MNSCLPLRFDLNDEPASWPLRATVAVVVLALHALAFAALSQRNQAHDVQNNTIEIRFEAGLPQSPLSPPKLAQLKINAAPSRHEAPVNMPEPLPQAAAEPVAHVPAAVAAAAPAPATAPVAANTEPDYKASYLNNPPPAYPLAARRMGMQGRVLLHVEVLASGASGQVAVQQSSGYAMLDNAALQAVRSWRFQPATQAGRAVDKWFMIPVQFSLKESAA